MGTFTEWYSTIPQPKDSESRVDNDTPSVEEIEMARFLSLFGSQLQEEYTRLRMEADARAIKSRNKVKCPELPQVTVVPDNLFDAIGRHDVLSSQLRRGYTYPQACTLIKALTLTDIHPEEGLTSSTITYGYGLSNDNMPTVNTVSPDQQLNDPKYETGNRVNPVHKEIYFEFLNKAGNS